MKILLAVDGSEYTKRMLAYLAAHDLFSLKNTYHAFTVQTVLPSQARAALGQELVEKYYADESEAVLKPVLSFLQHHGLTVESSWQVGRPGELIAQTATEGKYDLVVMGSHGHGKLLNLVMGSVVNEVLAHCKVPVLIVR
ncbi:MAG: universal stress protein [Rhodoferax sp.]